MPKKIEDLQNRVFGYLTVKRYGGVEQHGVSKISVWECDCKCGNTCVVSHRNLLRGSTKSCGCLRRESMSKDLTDEQFGYLTVINKHGYRTQKNSKDRQIIWECQCQCGRKHLAPTGLLSSGHVKSCGCKKGGKEVEDLTGRVFGELVVLSFDKVENKRTFWLCKCSCGKERPLDAHHLKSGNQKSCGCRMGGWKHGLSKDKKAYRQYLFSDPIRKLRVTVGNQVRKAIGVKKSRASITKFLPYTIKELKCHLEKLWEPWMTWDNYGVRPNDKNKTWWIDHIIPQSKYPYATMDDPLFTECWKLENLRPLEKIANISKGDRDVV